MGKVIVIEHLTLDGVMQSPGHADEDRGMVSGTAAGPAGIRTRSCSR